MCKKATCEDKYIKRAFNIPVSTYTIFENKCQLWVTVRNVAVCICKCHNNIPKGRQRSIDIVCFFESIARSVCILLPLCSQQSITRLGGLKNVMKYVPDPARSIRLKRANLRVVTPSLQVRNCLEIDVEDQFKGFASQSMYASLPVKWEWKHSGNGKILCSYTSQQPSDSEGKVCFK